MILEKINQRILEEYKGGSESVRVFLQTLKALLINKKIELKGELAENDEISVLRVELKKIEESMSQYAKGGREDLAEKARAEVSILKGFLPEEMPEEEIEEKIKKIVENLPDKNFGMAMKAVMAELKGKVDGSIVSEKVKKILEN